jgi:hypothetical protein
MRSEREIIVEITRIGHVSKSVDEALKAAQSVLANEIGGSTLLLVDPAELGISSWAAKFASEFLDSREFPFRGLYTAPLMLGSERAGRLIACFGSFESPGELLQRLTAHVALQFGQMLARIHREVSSLAEAA